MLTAPDAMREGAPILHDDLKTKEFGEQTDRVSNVADHFRSRLGDIDKGFAEADVIVEREFDTATVHQGYIEPHNATALWNNDGRVLIWCSTQGAFVVRDATACVLDLPVSRVKVTPMEIGGGFGGKIPVYLEPVAALLSKKTGQPVKIVMSRKDVFEGTGPDARARYIKVKIGARKDGQHHRRAGVSGLRSRRVSGRDGRSRRACASSPPTISPTSTIDGYDVVVNKPSTAAYRAPGATNAAFATETVVDEIAEKLGIDPLEFRLKNAAKEGTRRADGPKYRRIGCVEVLEAMKNHPHYKAPLGRPNRGRGVAIGFWFNVGLPSSCTISVNADGTVNLVEGSTDIGGTRTSIAMQAAEVLGIPRGGCAPDRGRYRFGRLHGGHRRQPHDVRHRLGRVRSRAGRGAPDEGARREDLGDRRRRRSRRSAACSAPASSSMTFQELAAKLGETGGPVVGRGAVNPRGVGGSFAGVIVDVEVDPETGKVTDPALHVGAGRRQGDSSQLRRRPDAGRQRAGHRLGAQRGVLHERRTAR